MQPRVFIIHGWGNHPEEGWHAWMHNKLVAKGIKVMTPTMPDTDHPVKEVWISYLEDLVEHCDEQTFFVGHSLGVPAILWYLERQLPSIRVGGAVLVAGFEHLSSKAETPLAQAVLGPWLKEPLHWEAIRGRSKKFVAIFSDNDPWVPLSNVKVFDEKLEAHTHIVHNRGHMSPSDNVLLPEALEELLAMMGDGEAQISSVY